MWVTWGLWLTFLPPRGQSTRGKVTITGVLLLLRLGQFGEWVCCYFFEQCNLGSKWGWLSASRSTDPCPMAVLLRGEEQPGPQTSPSGGLPQIHPLWKGCPGGMDPVGSSPSTNLVQPWPKQVAIQPEDTAPRWHLQPRWFSSKHYRPGTVYLPVTAPDVMYRAAQPYIWRTLKSVLLWAQGWTGDLHGVPSSLNFSSLNDSAARKYWVQLSL